MSQVDTRLGMSLDSIISSKPRVKKDKPARSAGGKKNADKVVRSAGKTNNRHGKVQRQPNFNKPQFKQPQAASFFEEPAAVAPVSIFDRLGKIGNGSEPSGTKILISNLHGQITSSDIAELCGSIGETKRVDVSAGNAGGVLAEVIFARQSDALNCVTKLDGLALDNRPMAVKLANGYGAAKPQVSKRDNVRVGLFGTANQDAPAASGETTFSVTLGAGKPQSQNNRRQQQQRVVVVKPGQQERQGRQQRERGNGNARGGRNGGTKQQKPTSSMDLDADLDSYMGNETAAPPAGGRKGRKGREAKASVTAEDLDADMDAYRSNV